MISIIIPTFNEADIIANTINRLRGYDRQNKISEILVCDGGSTDNTIIHAEAAGAKILTGKKGRAAQMNAGASVAKGKLLYFLHADTMPPKNFIERIISAYGAGYTAGCFRLQFDFNNWFLKANAWFTRFNINAFRFGDQSLFVTKEVFVRSGGFNERLIILEDQEIIPRLQQHGKFVVIDQAVITSSRKYIKNGIYKTQAVYFLIFMLYKLGLSQQSLLKLYRKLIVQDKL